MESVKKRGRENLLSAPRKLPRLQVGCLGAANFDPPTFDPMTVGLAGNSKLGDQSFFLTTMGLRKRNWYFLDQTEMLGAERVFLGPVSKSSLLIYILET